jgi:hypothetical protein
MAKFTVTATVTLEIEAPDTEAAHALAARLCRAAGNAVFQESCLGDRGQFLMQDTPETVSFLGIYEMIYPDDGGEPIVRTKRDE